MSSKRLFSSHGFGVWLVLMFACILKEINIATGCCVSSGICHSLQFCRTHCGVVRSCCCNDYLESDLNENDCSYMQLYNNNNESLTSMSLVIGACNVQVNDDDGSIAISSYDVSCTTGDNDTVTATYTSYSDSECSGTGSAGSNTFEEDDTWIDGSTIEWLTCVDDTSGCDSLALKYYYYNDSNDNDCSGNIMATSITYTVADTCMIIDNMAFNGNYMIGDCDTNMVHIYSDENCTQLVNSYGFDSTYFSESCESNNGYYTSIGFECVVSETDTDSDIGSPTYMIGLSVIGIAIVAAVSGV